MPLCWNASVVFSTPDIFKCRLFIYIQNKNVYLFLNCICIPSVIPGIFSCTQSVHWTRSECEVRHGHSARTHAINRQIQVELLENAATRRELCRNASIAERTPWHIFLVKTSYKKWYNFLKKFPYTHIAIPWILKRRNFSVGMHAGVTESLQAINDIIVEILCTSKQYMKKITQI